MKLQTAFEYLLSYGWAILIMAVVIAALFQSGALNPSSFYPIATPGSCQVVRPMGPLSTQFLSLSGTCNSGLPQSTAEMLCSWPDVAVCNPNFIKIHMNETIDPLTMSVWFWEPPDIYIPGSGTASYSGVLIQLNGSEPALWVGQGANTKLCAFNHIGSALVCGPIGSTPGQWNHAVATMTNSIIDLYLNGQLIASGQGSPIYGDGGGYIGVNTTCNCFFSFSNHSVIAYYNSGYENNVQIYNTTLTANDISALYDEGINGAPINLNNLIGWWPLNGNANDYSGNGFDGNATGIIWSGTWRSTYAGQVT